MRLPRDLRARPPLADEDGFRTDVLELVRELGVTTVRYPGGDFVSGFRWEDSVGPTQNRPRRLDLAWHSTESNEVGIDEFTAWLEGRRRVMFAVNLGTRGIQEALDVLEYANVSAGTELRTSGRRTAQRSRSGCGCGASATRWTALGSSATAAPTTTARGPERQRRCGSSTPRSSWWPAARTHAQMPTFGSWEHTVLKS